MEMTDILTIRVVMVRLPEPLIAIVANSVTIAPTESVSTPAITAVAL